MQSKSSCFQFRCNSFLHVLMSYFALAIARLFYSKKGDLSTGKSHNLVYSSPPVLIRDHSREHMLSELALFKNHVCVLILFCMYEYPSTTLFYWQIKKYYSCACSGSRSDYSKRNKRETSSHWLPILHSAILHSVCLPIFHLPSGYMGECYNFDFALKFSK